MRSYFSGAVKLYSICIIFVSFLLCLPECVSAKSSESGLVKEGKSYVYYVRGERLKDAWKTIKDKKTGKKYKYYFGENGKAIVSGSVRLGDKVYVFDRKGRLIQKGKNVMVTLNGKTYYVDKNGQAVTGWLKIKHKVYLADSRGRFYKRRTCGDISFDHETGEINQDTAGSLKIKTMEIVSSITNDSMTRSQKLRACWNYITHRGGFYYSPVYPDLNQLGWQKSMALRMLTYIKRKLLWICLCICCAGERSRLPSQRGLRPCHRYERRCGRRTHEALLGDDQRTILRSGGRMEGLDERNLWDRVLSDYAYGTEDGFILETGQGTVLCPWGRTENRPLSGDEKRRTNRDEKRYRIWSGCRTG